MVEQYHTKPPSPYPNYIHWMIPMGIVANEFFIFDCFRAVCFFPYISISGFFLLTGVMVRCLFACHLRIRCYGKLVCYSFFWLQVQLLGSRLFSVSFNLNSFDHIVCISITHGGHFWRNCLRTLYVLRRVYWNVGHVIWVIVCNIQRMDYKCSPTSNEA